MTSQQREWLQWLKQRCDAVGECDRCHRDGQALYSLPMELDGEPDAHWLYCPECFRRKVMARKNPR